MNDDGYLLDNRDRAAGVRLEALAAVFDPWTFDHLRRVGLAPGWRCWEVGAGGPSVATWLAGQVGPEGSVLATDLDLSWLDGAPEPSTGRSGRPNATGGRSFDALRHDIGVDPPPEGPFDLVHVRLVLVHVPQRDHALQVLAGVLVPGGWLVVEDADPMLQPLACPDEIGPDQELANRIRSGFRSLLEGRGAELAFGRTLPRRLREAGLVDVESDGFFPITSGAGAVLERTTIEQIRGQLSTGRLATDEEIDRHLANLDAGLLDVTTAPMISAWGRRPNHHGPRAS